ncbi:CPBP family intramembrane metalloprotease [Acidobacteria bacterium AH-259-L09]|nr:CPBP family intramembrane metalloprotease [Acidobacteria bacterium AH-259-L09]
MACALGWLLDYPPFEQIHLRWQAVARGLVATCPPLLALLWCIRSQWGPFHRLLREVEETLVPLFAGCSDFELALISILAGFGEEALFRGAIQTTLANLFNPWLALAVASTLFGLAHFITPTYAALASLIGLYLGWLSMVYNNLLLAIIVHALYDFVALMYLVRKYKARHEDEPPPGSVNRLRENPRA